jgi:hypothetical protein
LRRDPVPTSEHHSAAQPTAQQGRSLVPTANLRDKEPSGAGRKLYSKENVTQASDDPGANSRQDAPENSNPR